MRGELGMVLIAVGGWALRRAVGGLTVRVHESASSCTWDRVR